MFLYKKNTCSSPISAYSCYSPIPQRGLNQRIMVEQKPVLLQFSMQIADGMQYLVSGQTMSFLFKESIFSASVQIGFSIRTL